MKKLSLLCIVLCLCLLWSGIALTVSATAPDSDVPETTQSEAPAAPVIQNSVYTEGDASVTYGAATLDGQKPLGGTVKRLETAKAALLYEINSDTLLYTWNPDTRVHPASLVKVMTCMIALEEGELTDPVTVTAEMRSQLKGADLQTDFKEGEQITLGDLVHSAMVSSSNASSTLIAIHISGSEGAFVARMNARAKELGCTDTNFVNAHGIPHDSQYTTARDMARIVAEAVKSETFCQVFGAKNYTIPATNLSEERELKTTNYFISNQTVQKFYDSRVTGGKSGAASTEDRSVVFTAESGELKLLGVVMGAEGKTEEDGYSLKRHGNFEEATELMNYGFNHYSTAQILFSSKSVAQFSVENGANDVVGRPVSSAFSAVPVGTAVENLSWQYVLKDSLIAPVEKGSVIGAVQVWCGDVCIAQSDMVSMNGAALSAAAGQTHQDQRTEEENDGFTQFLMVIAILVGAALILGALLMAVLWIRAAVAESRRRKRRQSRQRSR